MVFLAGEIEVLSHSDYWNRAVVLDHVLRGSKHRSSHSTVSMSGDGLCRPVEDKPTKLAKVFAEFKAPAFGVVQPDAAKLIASGTPHCHHKNVGITIEIDIFGTKPVGAFRWGFHI